MSDPADPAIDPDVALVRAAWARRGAVSDREFDGVLSAGDRARSTLFWTPAPVALQAAHWIERYGARTVIDVGSGVGKFAILAALSTQLRVVGVEQRPSLARASRALVARFGLSERVRIEEGNFLDLQGAANGALYAFNPFGENLFADGEHIDSAVELSFSRFRRECSAFTSLLHLAPVGQLLCTFNGFGGRVPRSFELVQARSDLLCPLRLWRKRSGFSDLGDLPEEELAELVGA